MARRKAASKKRSRPGRLRIVAGNWRSRLLPVAEIPGLRPTSERIRETLFNWLGDAIVGRHCLDLYAGTGALGFEALSRGAATATFVEKAHQAADALRESARLLEADNASIVCGDGLAWLRGEPVCRFDLVFLDPPFADDLVAESCRLLQSKDWLAAGARVYLEQDRRQPPHALPDGWEIEKEKAAGNVRYSLIRVGESGKGRDIS